MLFRGLIYFNFMQFSGKNGQNKAGVPTLRVGAPSKKCGSVTVLDQGQTGMFVFLTSFNKIKVAVH